MVRASGGDAEDDAEADDAPPAVPWDWDDVAYGVKVGGGSLSARVGESCSWVNRLPNELRGASVVTFEPGDQVPPGLVKEVYDTFGDLIEVYNEDHERLDKPNVEKSPGGDGFTLTDTDS